MTTEPIPGEIPPAFQKEAETKPQVIPAIYLSGPMPRGTWCATCVMLFMGTISAEVEFQDYVKTMHMEAMQAGAGCISVELKERENMQLQLAITVAPSEYFPSTPMPVCWTHVVGFRNPTEAEKQSGQSGPQQQSRIIPGKSYGTDQYRG